MDLVIWVDEDDQILGEVPRAKAHNEAILHRIAATYLVNEQGHILVQERAKDDHLDHSSAGHVDPGETYLDAALRELAEELGVTGVELTELGRVTCHDRNLKPDGTPFNSRHMVMVFATKSEPVTLDPEEVRDAWWVDPQEVLQDMQNAPEKYTAGFRESLPLLLESGYLSA